MVQKKNNKKKHLTQAERQEIKVWLKERKSYRFIWKKLDRDHTVISREVKRNSIRCKRTWWNIYKPEEAERLRLVRRQKANQKHILLFNNLDLQIRLESLLKRKGKERGPDEILWRLRYKWFKSVAASTLYRFIDTYKKERKKYLRFGRHGYRKRGSWKKKTALVGVPLIDERSKTVDERKEIGHWEADMVVWPQGEKWWLVTLVERCSRYVLISKVPRSTKDYVYSAMYTMLHNEKVLSTTSDNWSEFASLALLWTKLWSPVYRCHPYASREKWTNEKTNGFIRWFCPKWLPIQQYGEEYIMKVQSSLNHKPRKILGYKSPYEVYHNTEIDYLNE